MTVVQSVTGRVKPGRSEEHLALSGEAVKLFERLGAGYPRLSFPVAGEAPGVFTFSTEYPNAEAWGEFSDRLAKDVEFQAFVVRASGDNAPTTIETSVTAYEIPLRANNPTRGNYIDVHVTRPVPGRFEVGLEIATRVLELVEARGATNARLCQLGYAGAGSGLFVMTWEFDSLKTHGRLVDSWSTDPELAALAARARFGPEPPSTPVYDALYQVVPL